MSFEPTELSEEDARAGSVTPRGALAAEAQAQAGDEARPRKWRRTNGHGAGSNPHLRLSRKDKHPRRTDPLKRQDNNNNSSSSPSPSPLPSSNSSAPRAGSSSSSRRPGTTTITLPARTSATVIGTVTKTDNEAGVTGTSVYQFPGRHMVAKPYGAIGVFLILTAFIFVTLFHWYNTAKARRDFRARRAAATLPSSHTRAKSVPMLAVPIPPGRFSVSGDVPIRPFARQPRGSVVVAKGEVEELLDFSDSARPRTSFWARRFSQTVSNPQGPSTHQPARRPPPLDLFGEAGPNMNMRSRSPSLSEDEKRGIQYALAEPLPAYGSNDPQARIARGKSSGSGSRGSPPISRTPTITVAGAKGLSRHPTTSRLARTPSDVSTSSPSLPSAPNTGLRLDTSNLGVQRSLSAGSAVSASSEGGGLKRQNTQMRSPMGGTMSSRGVRDSSFGTPVLESAPYGEWNREEGERRV